MRLSNAAVSGLKYMALVLGTPFGVENHLFANGGSSRTITIAESEQRKARSLPYHRRTTCRICGSLELSPFLDFGAMPLANAYRRECELNEAEMRIPLSAMHCLDCGLVQVPEVVDPRVLFRTYTYFSSASVPMVEHFRVQADRIRERYLPKSSDLICEIGSNDGIFLQNFVGKCRVVGIDPADNIATIAAIKGVTTVNQFFNPQTATTVRSLFGSPRVIFAANCFAHIDDIHGVMEGIVRLLDDDGVFIFENHRFTDMLRTRCFDQIYHEHLCFYTLKPIEHLMQRYGMRVVDVQVIATQGESFQVHCARIGSRHRVQPSVQAIRNEEQALGLDDPETFARAAKDVDRLQRDLKSMLHDLHSQGKRIVGYGAPGKATTLLNSMEIDHETIEYVVDSTPIKQGRFIPGTRIPIRAPEALANDAPDYLLLLAWNYADAILSREQPIRDRGVKFIVPVPELRIV